MARICPLFSGSTGNSTYIGTSAGGLLVDAGATYKALSAALEAAGGSTEEIKNVLITHEHSDHIKGLKTFLSKSGASLTASAETLRTLIKMEVVPASTKIREIGDSNIDLDGITATRFATSHDCPGSSGYSFLLPDGNRVSVCTDLGVVTDTVRNAVYGSDLVLFESNHDLEMLKKGPYPPYLKMRILSEHGHISNNTCASELPEMLIHGATRFILGHLSRKNNMPMLAENAAVAALMDISAQRGRDYILSVASPSGNGVMTL